MRQKFLASCTIYVSGYADGEVESIKNDALSLISKMGCIIDNTDLSISSPSVDVSSLHISHASNPKSVDVYELDK